MNNLGETIASLSISDNNPLEAAVAEGVKQQSPNATLEFGETAIGNEKKITKTSFKNILGMADPPKTDEDLPDFFNPNDPEEGENILMKFGINETLLETNNSTENATYATSAIKELVAEATNGLVDIDELQTADQVMAQEQAKRDQGKLLKNFKHILKDNLTDRFTLFFHSP